MRTLPVLMMLIAGCTNAPAGPPQGGGGGMPPGEVGIVTLKTEQITLQTELAGRTAARLTSELRPQVSGIVKERTFEEGARVKAGQVLYRIDPAMYRAAYAQASADLSSAKASLEAAQTRSERYAKLMAIEGVSKQEADDARAAYQQAVAGVAQKQAALQAAKINLDYTSIKAPITGRIGTSTVTVGALVTANQPEPLATIRSLDPIFVDLTESSEVRLKLRAQLGTGALKEGSTRVKLRLGDGSLYAHDGTLEFAEVAVDEATGTVTLRAQFPNPDDTLLPGMYVRAVLDQGIAQDAILAPQQGISHDATGKASAMVVGANNTVEMRPVTAERAVGDRWLVTDGLKAGDKLIVEGLGKIGPGMPVNATEVVVGAQAGSGGSGSGGGSGGGGGSAEAGSGSAPAGSGSGSGSGSATGI
jgi:membrane fusion protein, multidrug efflux system